MRETKFFNFTTTDGVKRGNESNSHTFTHTAVVGNTKTTLHVAEKQTAFLHLRLQHDTAQTTL